MRSSIPKAPELEVARPAIYNAVEKSITSLQERGALVSELIGLKDPNHRELNGIITIFLKLQLHNSDHTDDIMLFVEFFNSIGLQLHWASHWNVLHGHFCDIFAMATLGDVK